MVPEGPIFTRRPHGPLRPSGAGPTSSPGASPGFGDHRHVCRQQPTSGGRQVPPRAAMRLSSSHQPVRRARSTTRLIGHLYSEFFFFLRFLLLLQRKVAADLQGCAVALHRHTLRRSMFREIPDPRLRACGQRDRPPPADLPFFYRAASHARTPSPLSPLWAVADLRKSPRARTRPVRRGGRANLERNSHRAAARVAAPPPTPLPPSRSATS